MSKMKIRKTSIQQDSTQQNVYIYENKKEQYIVVAIPYLEWSMHATYDDFAHIESRLQRSLANVLDEQYVRPLAMKLAQWMREM
ncbi:YueH family protein [Anoxybacillus sp. TBDG-1]